MSAAPRRLVVTGTGRCGTGYIAQCLLAAGVACGHEAVYHPATVTERTPPQWGAWQAESSWIAAPLLPADGVAVVAVVRHPLGVVHSQLAIGSLAGPGPANQWEAVVAAVTPQVWDHAHPHDRALAHWLAWNELAVAAADLVVLLEEVNPSVVHAMAALADIPVRGTLAAERAVPALVNHKPLQRRAVPALRSMDFEPRLAGAARDVWADLAGDSTPW